MIKKNFEFENILMFLELNYSNVYVCVCVFVYTHACVCTVEHAFIYECLFYCTMATITVSYYHFLFNPCPMKHVG